METTIALYLKGDEMSRKTLEEFVSSVEFWEVIPTQLTLSLSWPPDSTHFLMIMVSRRLALFRNEEVPMSILDTLLGLRHNASTNLLMDALSSSLALVTLNQPQNIFKSSQFIQQYTKDIPILTIKYLTELASQSKDEEKSYLREFSNTVIELCASTLVSAPDDRLRSATISCVRIWMNTNLISHINLLNGNQNNIVEIFASLCLPNQSYSLTLLSIADFYDDVLLALADSQGQTSSKISQIRTITIQTGDHSTLSGSNDIPHSLEESSELSPVHHETLIQYLAQQSSEFQRVVHSQESSTQNNQRVSWHHSYLRIIAATLKFLFNFTANPFGVKEMTRICSDFEILSLFQQISVACHHKNVSYAAIAMEAVFFSHNRMAVECKRILKENSIFRVICDGCLYHFCNPPDDDSELDLDAWLMYREQVVGDTFRACYLELRSSLLQGMMSSIESELNSPTFNSVNVIVGNIVALKYIGIDLSTRAQLNVANKTSLFNVSRAGRSLETPEIISSDSKLTCDFLVSLFKGIFFAYSSGQEVMQHRDVVSATIKLIGVLAPWIGKGKISLESSSINVFDEIGTTSVGYVLNGLGNPYLFYFSASTLRTLCTRCGKQISLLPDVLESLLNQWRTLCAADQSTMRRQLHETIEELGGEYEIFSRVDDNTDILLEVEKTIVQAICMVLKSLPSESTRYYIEALLQPPMEILIAGFQNSSVDVRDLVAMITIITMFVRSIRIDQSKKDQIEPTERNQDNTDVDLKAHPALEIMFTGDGHLFHHLLTTFPTSQISESVSYFLCSIVTYVSPLLPVYQLPQLCSMICRDHLQLLISSSPTSAFDLAKEILSVIGCIVQYQRSKQLVDSTYVVYDCGESTVIALEQVMIELVSTLLLSSSAQFEEMSGLTDDITSPQWNMTRHAVIEKINSEQYEMVFAILQSLLDSVSCISHQIPNLFEATRFAKLLMSKCCHNAAISLAACHFLKSVFSARRRSVELRKTFLSNSDTPKLDWSLEFSPSEHHINVITEHCRDGIILECLCELLSDEVSVHEALTEGQIGLFYVCLFDALETSSSEFPIQQCCNQLAHLLLLRGHKSLLIDDLTRIISYLILLCSKQAEKEYDFMSQEFSDYCSLLSNISTKKESLEKYIQFMNALQIK